MAETLWSGFSAYNNAIVVEMYWEDTTQELSRVYYKNDTTEPLAAHILFADGKYTTYILAANYTNEEVIMANRRPSLIGVGVTFGTAIQPQVRE